jgi:hypothetical protein
MSQSKNRKATPGVLYAVRLSPGLLPDHKKERMGTDLMEHTQYMLELFKNDILVIARAIDRSAGQLIIKAESDDHA